MSAESLELRHYAHESHMKLDREYDYSEHRNLVKPAGFWVSVQGEDDWPSWCRAEDWATFTLENEHVVTLADGANVLLLDSAAEVLEFTSEFKNLDSRWGMTEIDWSVVRQRWDGLIIAPYQWSLRLNVETDWYYGWDCASGCIWNLDAIASVEPSGRLAVSS